MATANVAFPRWAMKLIALALIVLGFLLAAYGYRSASFGTAVGGCALIVLGLVLLVGKIAARNTDRTA